MSSEGEDDLDQKPNLKPLRTRSTKGKWGWLWKKLEQQWILIGRKVLKRWGHILNAKSASVSSFIGGGSGRATELRLDSIKDEKYSGLEVPYEKCTKKILEKYSSGVITSPVCFSTYLLVSEVFLWWSDHSDLSEFPTANISMTLTNNSTYPRTIDEFIGKIHLTQHLPSTKRSCPSFKPILIHYWDLLCGWSNSSSTFLLVFIHFKKYPAKIQNSTWHKWIMLEMGQG